MKSVVDLTENDLVPIDGKTSRGSQEKIKKKKVTIDIKTTECASNSTLIMTNNRL